MASIQALKEFINERLTAAAAEIFTVVEQTFVRYQEEIDRQRKLLENSRKHRAKFHPAENVKEEQPSNLETNSTQEQDEPRPVQVKGHRLGLGTGREEDQLLLKQETADDHTPEPGGEDFLPHSSAVAAGSVQGQTQRDVSASNSELDSELGCPTAGDLHEAEPGKTCLQCGVCGKTFKRVSQMLRHHRSHTGEKPYSCLTCGRTFNHKHHLKNHMVIHSDDKPFFCEICSKRFKHKSSYLGHLKIHKGEKPHACDSCGKRFCERSNLLVHMRCHTDERPFFCKTCGKSYKYRNYLLVHMRTHTGERPFLCNTCGKSFATSSAMHKHAAIHSGEKPFSCVQCGKCFSVRDTLLRHMMTHTGLRRFQTQE